MPGKRKQKHTLKKTMRKKRKGGTATPEKGPIQVTVSNNILSPRSNSSKTIRRLNNNFKSHLQKFTRTKTGQVQPATFAPNKISKVNPTMVSLPQRSQSPPIFQLQLPKKRTDNIKSQQPEIAYRENIWENLEAD